MESLCCLTGVWLEAGVKLLLMAGFCVHEELLNPTGLGF